MSSQLRSASGSVAISFSLTTVPSTADCVSSSGVTPSTTTRSLTPPTGSVTSSCARWPTSSLHGLRDRLKTGGGNLDEPFAGAEAGHLIGAGISRLHLALCAACDGRQLDECPGHDGAGAVVHDAGQCRAIDLRAAGRWKRKKGRTG